MRNSVRNACRAFAFCAALIAHSVFAAEVQFRGEVDVRAENFRAFALKKSSFVRAMYYDRAETYLVVQLLQRHYHYCNVPAEVTAEWARAESPGKFYFRHVRGKFDCRESGAPDY